MQPNRTHRRLAASAVLLALWGCTELPEPPAGDTVAEAPEVFTAPVTPAEYSTEVAFVGFAAEPLRFYARFLNETTETWLERSYRAWWGDAEGWRELESLADELPVPRAGWRMLPGGPWRVVASDGGEFAGIIYTDSALSLQFMAGEPVAAWTGETGQRETLRLGLIDLGDTIQTGLLVIRRSARLRSGEAAPAAEGGPLTAETPVTGAPGMDAAEEDGEPGAAGGPAGVALAAARRPAAQIFLLADSLSNGLLIARDAADPDSSAVAWTWLSAIGNEWTDVRVSPPPENGLPAGLLGQWVVELPEAGIRAVFRASPSGDSGGDPVEGGPAVLSGRLEILGTSRPAAGLAVENRG